MSNVDLSDPAIADTWKALGEKGAVENWMLLNFVDKKKLQVLSKGKGGLSELKEQLKESLKEDFQATTPAPRRTRCTSSWRASRGRRRAR